MPQIINDECRVPFQQGDHQIKTKKHSGDDEGFFRLAADSICNLRT
jgi:hypothetical protein